MINKYLDETDDAELIRAAQEGDKDSFGMIFNKYKTKSYPIAVGLMGNRDDAWDVTQEAFARAWVHIDTFRLHEPFFPWFYQILRRLGLNKLKKHKNHSPVESAPNEKYFSKNSEFDPSVIAERNNRNDIIWKAVHSLSDLHREIIILRHFQELSYKKISETLFISKGTVMSRLYNARKELEKRLKRLKEQEVL